MSSRLVSSVWRSPMGPSLPSRPWSDLLPKLFVTPLATGSPIVIQPVVSSPRDRRSTAKRR